MTPWQPSRAEALRRLDEFVPRAGRAYARERNFDRGPGHHTAVSTLSPWIRHRILLEQEVITAVVTRHSLSAAEKFVQEVFWRTYWKGWLELRPGVWADYRTRVSDLVRDLDRNPDLRDRWQTATEARTGIECFDAWAGELTGTGYLHNHARMWFASIWVFTLDLPWELGADFFLRHLLDGDPASNTLSWRWVAGLQTRGKTYLARRANIARFTEGRFGPANGLSASAPAPATSPPPDASPPPDPAPPAAGLPTGVLLTEEDLDPGSLLADWQSDADVAVLNATGWRSPLGVAGHVRDYVRGAMDDALQRAGLGCAIRLDLTETDRDLERIVAWAADHRFEQVVTPYTPVGPAAEAMSRLTEALAERRIRLVPMLREYDRRAWPHATRGFFPFRKMIPALVRSILGAGSSAA